jgi:hypothetical protein
MKTSASAGTLVLGLILASLVAASPSGAKSCHSGFVTNQGKCVKKPPAGVPAPGLYKFFVGKQKIAIEVKYVSRKLVVGVVAKIPASAIQCNTSVPPSPDTLKAPSIKIVAKKFSKNNVTSSPGGATQGLFSGQFASASKITNFLYIDHYTRNDANGGGGCNAGNPGAAATATLKRASFNDF